MGAMQTDTTILLYKDEAISGIFYTDIIDIQQMEGFSFQIYWEGGAGIEGIATVEGSNDLNADVTLKKFSTVDRSSQKLVGTPGSHVYDACKFHYRYMRLKIDVTTSTAVFNIHFNSRSRRN